MTLIKTFSPEHDESGRGYFRRLASFNARSSWKDLAHECGARTTFDTLLAHPEHVSHTLGLELAWCEQATARDDLARTWRGFRRHSRDFVCVHCLQESAHLRATWEHAYMVACPSHGVLLRDACPACHAPLGFGREHIEFCECGFDLRASATEPATPAQLWLSSLIATGDASIAGCGPVMAGADTTMAATLINTLCKQPDPQIQARRSNAPAPSSMQELIAFLQPLEHWLANWPANFERHISERMRHGPSDARTLNRRLGTWVQQLCKLSAHTASHPFIDAVKHVAEAEFDGVIRLPATSTASNEAVTRVTLSGAADRIGIQYTALMHHRSKGALLCKATKSGTRGVVYQVTMEEVNAIIDARKMWTSEDAACEMLGVPPAVLTQLCEAGVVVREAQWKEDLRKGGPLKLASIQQFSERLHASAAPQQVVGRRIKLCELSLRRVGDKKALAAALQAIAAGVVCAVNAEGLVGNYEFAWNHIAQYYATPLLDQSLTIQGLSEATGYKHECISHWVGLGLLAARDIMDQGQRSRVVSVTQLADFRRQYVPLSDMAKEMGTKSSALARQLADSGIDIVGGLVLPGGERRGCLVRIADIGRAALRNAGRTSGSHALAALRLPSMRSSTLANLG